MVLLKQQSFEYESSTNVRWDREWDCREKSCAEVSSSQSSHTHSRVLFTPLPLSLSVCHSSNSKLYMFFPAVCHLSHDSSTVPKKTQKNLISIFYRFSGKQKIYGSKLYLMRKKDLFSNNSI